MPSSDSRCQNTSDGGRLVFLWLPTLVILGYLARHIDFSVDAWPNRPFNQIERLLHGARDRPRISVGSRCPEVRGAGLVPGRVRYIAGASAAPADASFDRRPCWPFRGAFHWRRKYPLLALPVLFFFAGHLLESTVIGLELYFEHRNYLPAAFLFMPLAAGIVWLSKRFSVGLGELLSRGSVRFPCRS